MISLTLYLSSQYFGASSPWVAVISWLVLLWAVVVLPYSSSELFLFSWFFSVFFRDYSLRFREFSIFCRELSLCRCDFLVGFAVSSYSVSLLVDPVLFSWVFGVFPDYSLGFRDFSVYCRDEHSFYFALFLFSVNCGCAIYSIFKCACKPPYHTISKLFKQYNRALTNIALFVV